MHFKNKKTALLCVLLTVILFISSCGISENKITTTSEKLTVVATIFPAYDFAREIAGGYADVHMLLKPGNEVHTYEPTPNDIKLINDCDVFIYTGGESDSWIDGVLDSIDSTHMRTVKMIDCVEALEEEITEGMQTRESHSEDENESHEEHEYDEHVWTSPVNAIKISKNIADTLSEADPSHSDIYNKNFGTYSSSLSELDKQFREIVKNAKRRTMVFGDRFPLLYFAKEYKISYYAAYPGCAAESEPNVATVAFLIEKVKEENIPVVFHIELSNEKMADTICEETGAEKLLFSSCHNVTAQQFSRGVTYLELMEGNVTALEKALN